MAATRFKVDVERLKTRIQAALTEAEAKDAAARKQYEADKAAYDKADKKPTTEIVRVLNELLAEAKRGELDRYVYQGNRGTYNQPIYYNYLSLSDLHHNMTVNVPVEPVEPQYEAPRIKRDLSLLELSSESTIMISAEDRYARYLD